MTILEKLQRVVGLAEIAEGAPSLSEPMTFAEDNGAEALYQLEPPKTVKAQARALLALWPALERLKECDDDEWTNAGKKGMSYTECAGYVLRSFAAAKRELEAMP